MTEITHVRYLFKYGLKETAQPYYEINPPLKIENLKEFRLKLIKRGKLLINQNVFDVLFITKEKTK